MVCHISYADEFVLYIDLFPYINNDNANHNDNNGIARLAEKSKDWKVKSYFRRVSYNRLVHSYVERLWACLWRV